MTNKKLGGVLRDEVIWYTGCQSVKKYPGELRLVEFYDEEHEKTYQFITNNFHLAASSIAEIYKQRWQIELFFNWFKQNLKIKSILGASEKCGHDANLGWALIHYLLIAYIKFLNRIELSLTDCPYPRHANAEFVLAGSLSWARKTLLQPPD